MKLSSLWLCFIDCVIHSCMHKHYSLLLTTMSCWFSLRNQTATGLTTTENTSPPTATCYCSN